MSEEVGENAGENIEEKVGGGHRKLQPCVPADSGKGFHYTVQTKWTTPKRIAGSRESTTEKRTGTHQMMEDKM